MAFVCPGATTETKKYLFFFFVLLSILSNDLNLHLFLPRLWRSGASEAHALITASLPGQPGRGTRGIIHGVGGAVGPRRIRPGHRAHFLRLAPSCTHGPAHPPPHLAHFPNSLHSRMSEWLWETESAVDPFLLPQLEALSRRSGIWRLSPFLAPPSPRPP